jgi:hypothetical protein
VVAVDADAYRFARDDHPPTAARWASHGVDVTTAATARRTVPPARRGRAPTRYYLLLGRTDVDRAAMPAILEVMRQDGARACGRSEGGDYLVATDAPPVVAAWTAAGLPPRALVATTESPIVAARLCAARATEPLPLALVGVG